jgi:hypothetical protein
MRHARVALWWAAALCLLAAGCAAAPLAAPRVGDNWGVNIHFTAEPQPGEAAMLARGFRVARMDLTWALVERTCGEYDFTAYDGLLRLMRAHGIRPYWILDYANAKCYPGQSGPTSCDTPACVEGYGRFAAAVAARFRGAGVIFESVNEPNEPNMANLTAATAARLARAAGPHFKKLNETFVGPALAGLGFKSLAYLGDAIVAGLLGADFAGISVHAYGSAAPESRVEAFAALRAVLDGAGAAAVPIVNGEWGYNTSPAAHCHHHGRATDAALQGKYLPRMWLAALMANVSVSIAYDWHDDGPAAGNCEDNFGSVFFAPTGNASLPYRPKPMYVAAVAAQATVGNSIGYRGLEPITHTSDFFAASYAMKFERAVAAPAGQDGTDMYAIWTTRTGAAVQLALRPPACAAAARCWQRVSHLSARGTDVCCAAAGAITLNVTDGVTYLV